MARNEYHGLIILIEYTAIFWDGLISMLDLCVLTSPSPILELGSGG